MAITFVAAGTGAGGTGTATPGMPAGATTGDFLILVIEGEGEDTSADSPPTGGAWNTVGSVASATSGEVDRTRCSVYWAWYNAGINRTVPDAGNHTIARIYAFRGVDATTPLDVTSTSGSSSTNATSHSAVTAQTSATNGAMAVLAFTHGDDVPTVSGFTNANLASVSDPGRYISTSGSDGTVDIMYGIRTTAGSIGMFSWSTSVSEERAWWAMVLRPTSGPTQYEESVAGTVTPSGVVTTSTSAAPRSFAGALSLAGDVVPVSTAPSASEWVKLSMGAGTGPTSDMYGVNLWIQSSNQGGTDSDIDLEWQLWQSGSTLIAQGSLQDLSTSNLGTTSYGLSLATQVTNWSDLELWVRMVRDAGQTSDTPRVADAWLSYPYVESGATLYYDTEYGTMAPTGVPVVEVATSTAGSTTPSAARRHTVAKVLAGTVSSSGVVGKTVASVLSGAIASAGARVLAVSSSIVGALTPASSRVQRPETSTAGTVTSAGDLNTLAIGSIVPLSLEGVITPTAGDVDFAAAKGAYGTSTPTGDISFEVTKVVTGVTAPAGVAIQHVATSMVGSVTSAGTVDTLKQVGLQMQSVEGTVTSAGTLSHVVVKALAGAFTPTSNGLHPRDVFTTYTGASTPAGVVTPQAIGSISEQTVVGDITPTGVVTPVAIGGESQASVSGVVSPTGTVTMEAQLVRSGVTAPSSDRVRLVSVAALGTVSSSGTVDTQSIGSVVQLNLSGALTPAGAPSQAASRVLAGGITSSGVLGQDVATSLTGTLSALAGVLSRHGRITTVGSVGSAGITTPVEIPGGGTAVKFHISGDDEGPKSHMDDCWVYVRLNTASSIASFWVQMKLYDGGTLIATDTWWQGKSTPTQNHATDLSAAVQVTDWSNLYVELDVLSVLQAPATLEVYDIWVAYPGYVGRSQVFTGTVSFGETTGGWPSWDTVWDGPAQGVWPDWQSVWYGTQEGLLRREVIKNLLGQLTPTASLISEIALVGVVALAGSVATRLFILRRPRGRARPTRRPSDVTFEKPDTDTALPDAVGWDVITEGRPKTRPE